jgi:hypothetical protein
MGHDGVKGHQWPRPFSREDRPATMLHYRDDLSSELTACGLSIFGRRMTSLATEATCVMCTRVALANMIIGRHLPPESP